MSNLPSTFSITRILLSIHLDQIFCMENKTFADMPFLVDSAHTPASGIRWKFSGNTVNADRIRWEQPKLLCSCSCLFFFYKYCVIRSPYSRINWLKTWSQLRYLWVHFFATFSLARYRSFSSAVSLGNTLLVLVTFRYWRFSPSIIFVGYIILRVSS